MQRLQAPPRFRELAGLASPFGTQRLARPLERAVHRITVGRITRIGRRAHRAAGLGRLAARRRRCVVERPRDFFPWKRLVVLALERSERTIEPLDRVGELFGTALSTLGAALFGGALFGALGVHLLATLFARLGPAALLIGQLEGLHLGGRSLGLQARHFLAAALGIGRGLAPFLERLARLVPRLAQSLRGIGRCFARHRLGARDLRALFALRFAFTARGGLAGAGRREAGGALDRLGRAVERGSAGARRTIAGPFELVLEAVDLRVHPSIGGARQRAADGRGLFGDLLGAARLLRLTTKIAERLEDRGPGEREGNGDAGGGRSGPEVAGRTKERARDDRLLGESGQKDVGLLHLQALERGGLGLRAELHRAREAILSVGESVEDAGRAHPIEAATTKIPDRHAQTDHAAHGESRPKLLVHGVEDQDPRHHDDERDEERGEERIEEQPTVHVAPHPIDLGEDGGRGEQLRRTEAGSLGLHLGNGLVLDGLALVRVTRVLAACDGDQARVGAARVFSIFGRIGGVVVLQELTWDG